MSELEPVTLEFLARQQARMLEEFAAFRDDVAVLTAVAMRQDATLSGLLAELRAMHSRHARLERRIRTLEEPTP